MSEYINLEDETGRVRCLKVELMHTKGDGYIYFDIRNEKDELQLFRVKQSDIKDQIK